MNLKEMKMNAIIMGATSGIGYEVAKVHAKFTSHYLERRKHIITVNWLYRLLVFFWQMIPRSIWIRMRIQ